MEANNNPKVGDYVFLFFDKTGSIFSARVLEKTVKETISDGLKTEYILEAYRQESDEVVSHKLKYSEEKCKMFSTLEDLQVELQEHVNAAVNAMLTECRETFTFAKANSEGANIEENITSRRK
ncbi:MAG: hypothetical protein CMB77_03920 [Euryarchaeota archaeon]|nr:hypothetical protein [Euryarchaeota archaeon]